MDHYEMVEKLRQKANVSYEEAKAALEKSDWDILDALVLLESEGRMKGEDAAREYTTQVKRDAGRSDGGHDWRNGLRKLWNLLRNLFSKGNSNQFLIRNRKGEEIVSMPITVLVLLLIFCWPASLIALVVGLFVGGRYSFQGPNVDAKVNDVMDKAADAVQKDGDTRQ